MEEDRFSKANAVKIGTDVRTAIENKLTEFAVQNKPLNLDVLLKEIVGQLSANTLKKSMQNLSSSSDSDDFGGMYLVGGVTFPGGQVWTYAGHPKPASPLFVGTSPLMIPGVMFLSPSKPSRNFSLSFQVDSKLPCPRTRRFRESTLLEARSSCFNHDEITNVFETKCRSMVVGDYRRAIAEWHSLSGSARSVIASSSS